MRNVFPSASVDTHPPFSHNLNATPCSASSKKRPLEEKEMDYIFAKPVSVAPTPRKTKRQSPGNTKQKVVSTLQPIH